MGRERLVEAVVKEVSHACCSAVPHCATAACLDSVATPQDYLKIMLDTFEQAEDLESISDLHALFTLMQTIREIFPSL